MRLQKLQLVTFFPIKSYSLFDPRCIGNPCLLSNPLTCAGLRKSLTTSPSKDTAVINVEIETQPFLKSTNGNKNEVTNPSKLGTLINRIWSAIFLRKNQHTVAANTAVQIPPKQEQSRFYSVEDMIQNIERTSNKVETLKKRYETLKSLRSRMQEALDLLKNTTGDQVAVGTLKLEDSKVSTIVSTGILLEVLKYFEPFMKTTMEEPKDNGSTLQQLE